MQTRFNNIKFKPAALILLSLALASILIQVFVGYVKVLLMQENTDILVIVTDKSADISGERLENNVHEAEAQAVVAEIMYSLGLAPAEILQELDQAHNQEFYDMSIIDNSGRAVNLDSSIEYMDNDAFFIECLQTGDTVLSPPIYFPVERQQYVVIYVPITIADGSSIVLRLEMSLDVLYRDLELQFFGNHGFSFIADHSGRILTGSENSEQLRVAFANIYEMMQDNQVATEDIEKVRRDFAALNSDAMLINYDGEQMLVCYSPLQSENGWYFVSVIQENVMLKNSFIVVKLILILCFIIAAIIFLGVFLLQRQTRRQNLHIKELAYTDALTGLHNRFYIEEMVLHDLEDHHAHAGVIFDIDKFKMINEALGREAGDNVLCGVAEVLQRCIGRGESCARMGSDQFFMILHYQERYELMDRMSGIFDAAREEIAARIDDDSIISFSCGICDITEREQELVSVFDQADIARKSIKEKSGDNVCFFDNSMLSVLQTEKMLEDRMQRALNSGEFVPWFQPKVDMLTGRLHGAEALVRWENNDMGVVPPHQFIPLFEKNGFITRVDFAMFERVCQLKRVWMQRGLADFPISINMSRNHFLNRRFISRLSQIAAHNGVSLRDIEIEITESAFFYDSDLLITTMKDIKAAGMRLAMDDFGAGYSSLNLLKSIPIDVLKIDKEFLADDADNERGRTIILSILRMAKKIGVEVVCEGVETQSQADFLLQGGCRYGQGYLFARPMRAAEFEEYMLLQKR